MPVSPTTSTVTQARPDIALALTQFDLAMDRMGFIGLRVLPPMAVATAKGQFPLIKLESLLEKAGKTRRSPTAGYDRGNFDFTKGDFATEEHGVEEVVDDNLRELYRDWVQSDTIAAQRAMDRLLRGLEIRIADMVFNATTWTGATLTTAVGTEWSNKTSSDPLTDVKNARKKVWDKTGIWPNALIINKNVYHNLRVADAVKDAIRSAGAGDRTLQTDINEDILASVFDVDQVLVAGSAKQGDGEKETPSRSLSPIWSDEYAMVARIETGDDFRAPCIGRTFHWSQDGSSIGGTVERYREESVRGDIIRVRHQVGPQVLYTECAHLLSNITA